MKTREKPEANFQVNDDDVMEQANKSPLHSMAIDSLDDIRKEIRKEIEAAMNGFGVSNATRSKKEHGSKKNSKKTPPESPQTDS
jgi:hypothetical protein